MNDKIKCQAHRLRNCEQCRVININCSVYDDEMPTRVESYCVGCCGEKVVLECLSNPLCCYCPCACATTDIQKVLKTSFTVKARRPCFRPLNLDDDVFGDANGLAFMAPLTLDMLDKTCQGLNAIIAEAAGRHPGGIPLDALPPLGLECDAFVKKHNTDVYQPKGISIRFVTEDDLSEDGYHGMVMKAIRKRGAQGFVPNALSCDGAGVPVPLSVNSARSWHSGGKFGSILYIFNRHTPMGSFLLEWQTSSGAPGPVSADVNDETVALYKFCGSCGTKFTRDRSSAEGGFCGVCGERR